MDERLSAYFSEPSGEPPKVCEALLARELERRERGRAIILSAAGSMLWALLAAFFAAYLWEVKPEATFAAFIGLCACISCSGLLSAAIVFQNKKRNRENVERWND